jgi:glyoxylase-like metal-dependent hydrolase (beta-lactamase superfamily II)
MLHAAAQACPVAGLGLARRQLRRVPRQPKIHPQGESTMSVSRREFLAASAAFGAATMAGGLLGGCAAPLARATPVADGVTRVGFDSFSLTTLSDGYGTRALDANFVRNASLADVQAALRDAGLPTDKINIPYTAFVADVGPQRVLFDTGNGEFGAATAGRLLANMARAGMTPQSISAVCLSHFHGDHINGLRNKAGAIVFPNARIFVPEPEWAWWMDDARMAAAPQAMQGAFAATRRVFAPIASTVTRFAPGTELLPGVRSLPAFGHTPGHSAFVIGDGAQRLLYWGDNTNVAALFVRNPDWAVAFDMDAQAARVTRRSLADRAIRERMPVAGYHLPGAAIGTLSNRGAGYEFMPTSA